MLFNSIFSRVIYRIWQFKQVLLPRLDFKQWHRAVAIFDEPLRKQLGLLKKSEKAHIMRVYDDISSDQNLEGETRRHLLNLALLHDIGKTITRPSLLFKVAKVLFSFANTEHCIAGAKLLRRFKYNRAIIRQVLRHHDTDTDDTLLRLFQNYDDRN